MFGGFDFCSQHKFLLWRYATAKGTQSNAKFTLMLNINDIHVPFITERERSYESIKFGRLKLGR